MKNGWSLAASLDARFEWARRGLTNPTGTDLGRGFPEIFNSRSNSMARISEAAAGTLSNVKVFRKAGDHFQMAV
jgi:hypothetical protein